MLSKNKIKIIKSLSSKKYRDELSLFVVEGSKSVLDIALSHTCKILVATADWMNEHAMMSAEEKIVVHDDELKKISFLKTPQQVLAVFQKNDRAFLLSELRDKLSLVLDNIQDPGNLGTIIRIADWFGIENVFCSFSSVDVYNPKTIQATMGAISRVSVHYVDIVSFISSFPEYIPVYGTFLDGKNIYQESLSGNGLIVMGNEGNGISDEVKELVHEKLLIPSYMDTEKSAESLNVAVATAIVCSEFRRRI